MTRLQRAYYLAQAIGWENLPRRLVHALKGKLGIQKLLLPAGELPAARMRRNFVADYRPEDAREHWRRRLERFFVSPERVESVRPLLRQVVDDATWQREVGRVVDKLAQGRMIYFGRFFVDTGFPPRFNRDGHHGVDWPVSRHWSTYVQFDPGFKDLKFVWEPSRFSWAFHLARHCVRERDPRPAEMLWRCLSAWNEQNPYGLTAQWACGQESSFRLFAWLFAVGGTWGVRAGAGACGPAAEAGAGPVASDLRVRRQAENLSHKVGAGACGPQEAAGEGAGGPFSGWRPLHTLTERVWLTGRHVERNINYARGQKNNHALSEAVGLWTIGLLFPELRDAPRWRDKGRRVFVEELERQVAADGSYVQHSVNYHRVMLDDVLWAAALARAAGDDFPTRAHACAERALGWLLEMVDARSGGAPNYGLNDGARVLPLAATDYTDFRPVAQAAHYALRGSRCYEPGPWDEKLLWLFGPQALQAPLRRHERSSHWRADAGGYYAMRGPRTWGLTRCHTYRGRPGQADMLHLDLWLDQTNVLRDGGSYHYYTDPPWQDYFNSTAAHNTIEVDRRDQMIRGPRFTWFRWTRSRLIRFEQAAGGRLTCFEGEHEGYARLPGRVIHRRTICRIDDTYLVIDDLLGAGRHEIALRWRLCPAAWRACDEGYQSRVGDLDVTIALHHPDGLARELLTGQEAPEPEGWESLYYGEKLAVPILRVRGEAALPARLVSLISSEAGLRVADAGSHVTPLRLAGVARELARDLERVSAGRVLAG